MLQEHLNDIIAKTLAKQIEWSAAMARQFGFDFPKKYELGFKSSIVYSGEDSLIDIIIRVNELSFNYKITIGDLSAGIDRAAMETVGRYIDAHPEIKPDGATAQEVIEMLSLMEASNPETAEDILVDRAGEIADSATYTEVKS